MAENKSRRKKREEPKGDAKKDTVKTVEKVAPEERKLPAGRVGSRARAVKNLLAKVEETMTAEPIKATLGDYIRLVQLHKELDEEEPKEIRVTWVEPETKE